MPPIYEYICDAGHKFEEQQSIKDKPLKSCPVMVESREEFLGPLPCDEKCKRVISGTSFHLKGNGWYKDGYSSSGKKSK